MLSDRNAKLSNELTLLNQILDETRERLKKIDPPLSPVFMGNMEYFQEQVASYLEIVDG